MQCDLHLGCIAENIGKGYDLIAIFIWVKAYMTRRYTYKKISFMALDIFKLSGFAIRSVSDVKRYLADIKIEHTFRCMPVGYMFLDYYTTVRAIRAMKSHRSPLPTFHRDVWGVNQVCMTDTTIGYAKWWYTFRRFLKNIRAFPISAFPKLCPT